MKAIVLLQFGGVENLSHTTVPEPVPEEGEVLVRVKAISINPVDIKTRAGKGLAGKLKDERPLILGWDISGTVVESMSPAFVSGDEVFGMVRFPGHGKAYAEFVTAPASHLALKPPSVSHREASAATLAALTAWQALVTHARVSAGQKALIHAAAGGVGHFAVQIAKHLGAYVIGTSSAANRNFVLGLGADEHIDYHNYSWQGSPRDIDFCLDAIGGDNIDHSLEVIKEGGTLISIPSGMNETVAEKARAKGVKGYSILVQSSGDDMRKIAALLTAGALRAHISETFAFPEMAGAHLQIASGHTVGKIVVEP